MTESRTIWDFGFLHHYTRDSILCAAENLSWAVLDYENYTLHILQYA